MKNYNYANEIIKDYDQPNAQDNYKRTDIYSEEMQQQETVYVDRIKDTGTKIKVFEEALRNKNISTEENAKTSTNKK